MTTFDIRSVPAGHERWAFVKGFTEHFPVIMGLSSGVPQRAVQRNLTDAQVRKDGKERGLSKGRPSAPAIWLILHTDAVRSDVEVWTLENNTTLAERWHADAVRAAERDEEAPPVPCDFKGYALSLGYEG